MNSLSDFQQQFVLEKLSQSALFNNFSNKDLTNLLRNGELKEFDLSNILMEWDNLELSLVLEGCLASISVNNDLKVDSIDSFIFSGDVIGDFEYLDFIHKSRLVTISNKAILFTPNKDDISQIANLYPEQFYRNLSKSFVSKIKIQRDLMKIRSFTSITNRFASLLVQFRRDKWRNSINPINENKFDIEIFWSTKNLINCLLSDIRSIKVALKKFVEMEIIEIMLFSNPSELGSLARVSDFEKNFGKDRRDYEFIKVSVTDYSKLLKVAGY